MLRISLAAGDSTLQFFRTDALLIESKADDSPVTIADKQAEQGVRQTIAREYPSDTVQGEEYADAVGVSRYRWIVDPIDGTKSFVCGVPLYSSLLALLLDDEPIGGVIDIPALGETVCAVNGLGCWYRSTRASQWSIANVSATPSIQSSVLLTSQRDLFARRGCEANFAAIERHARVSRTWGDGYGYLMVATGRADIMVDPVCNPWDIAAMLPILREAGGRFSDWKGTATCTSGEGLATNGRIHDEVLAMLNAE